MASACWQRPGEGSFKQFPKLVKRTKIFYRPSTARVKVTYHVVPKLQTSKPALCPSARIHGALVGVKTHFQVLEPHFQPDRRGFPFLIMLFASVQSERFLGETEKPEEVAGGS